MKHGIDSFGHIITSNHNRIKISVNGSGTEVILLLSRKTSPAPILEMKPMVCFLKDKYTVVSFDYLGSGSSDNYHSKRTLENITNEIHEVMETLGYTTYTIVALAYAGLYSLYYANKYANEINAVIGIDTFVAEQKENETREENIKFYNNMWTDYHKSRLLQWIVEKLAVRYLKKSKSYIFDNEDIYDYSSSAAYMLEHMTLLDEYKCPDENFEKLRGIVFPSHIPVMFILSSRRCRKFRGWYDLHENLLRNSNSKIITLKGGKSLHLTHTERVAKEIIAFLDAIR